MGEGVLDSELSTGWAVGAYSLIGVVVVAGFFFYAVVLFSWFVAVLGLAVLVVFDVLGS